MKLKFIEATQSNHELFDINYYTLTLGKYEVVLASTGLAYVGLGIYYLNNTWLFSFATRNINVDLICRRYSLTIRKGEKK